MAVKPLRLNVLTAKVRPNLGDAVARAAKRTGRSISGFIRFACSEQCLKDGIALSPDDLGPPEPEAADGEMK